ncbi:vWA domain-containing protein [Kitasatospora sp. NBC_00458]|uniref:vWA domain-containing protein n=1 Tax=Kitasatospora sp. NBC_00458 TaxID=2903568 RepID=UPI002E19AFE6
MSSAVLPDQAGVDDPRETVGTEAARLAASGLDAPGPYLIGVRHHAPSLSAVVPALLDAARPEVLLVELPAEFQPWLDWLADESTRAPVALAAAPGGPGGPGEEGGDAGNGAGGLAFYPFADFSPELAALRWARRNGVATVACDLPLAHRDTGHRRTAPAAGERTAADPRPGVADALRHRLTGRDDDDDLWDRLVETAAPGSTPEAVRRAALLVGWALRRDAEEGPGVDPYDLRREAWMRARVEEASAGGRRVAAVIGAFHAPVLTAAHPADPAPAGGPADPVGPASPADPASLTDPASPAGPVGTGGTAPAVGHVVSLIPYTYPLLDARSGYPAGIRDPEWQHTVLDAAGDPDRLAEALTVTAVRICGALRNQDHPSGPADAREIVRLAGDLARLRGLAAPGRGELVEAVQTVLAQGEPLGRGRAVARALERVLVGTRTGRPAPGAPRSGLAPAVEALLTELGLPGPGDTAESAPRDLRLDPLRSPLDRRRELLLQRLAVCGVPYGEPVATAGAGGTETLSTRWRVQWTPPAAAMLTVAGTRGVTPAQAAEGALREHLRREQQADGPTARDVLRGLADAAACGLPALADTRLAQLTAVLPDSGTLPELLDALALLDRLGAGHVPGLAVGPSPGPGRTAAPTTAGPTTADQDAADPVTDRATAARSAAIAAAGEVVTVAAVRQLEGLGGSDDPADARALVELARRADLSGGIRLGHTLAELADAGSPLVRGAAGAVRVLLGQEEPAAFGDRAASWVDGATGPEARHALARSLAGLLTAAEGLLTSAPEVLEPLLERVVTLADDAFLDRLPALRGGFDTLSPAARDRLLTQVEEGLGARLDTLPDEVPPALLADWSRADLAARTALGRRGLLPAAPTAPDRPGPTPAPATTAPVTTAVTTTAPATPGAPAATPAHALGPAERWRLLLGRPGSGGLAGRSARLATALDELYGTGHGEGSGPGLDGRGGAGGGREAPYPGVREWSEELTALFGPGVREEVLAAAVAQGRTDALAAIDPGSVRPSVDLLRTVLEHAGGLPEARIAGLRPLVRRLVDELTRELATRLRPALTGISVPRPSRRPGGGLDLHRTIRANLATARPAEPAPPGSHGHGPGGGDGGGLVIVPERPVFRTRARKASDWRLILVVDVSGSMEASTVWAALTASILAGVPSLSTHFVAFSTEVVDLTDRVEDPLGLLLEVRIGGGTHIAAGLKYARELVTVPSRTLVAVISDFEEGGPVGGLLAQTRALVDSGCHVLGCAALDDTGTARYSKAVAGRLVAAGMPVAALSPLELARWVGEKVR